MAWRQGEDPNARIRNLKRFNKKNHYYCQAGTGRPFPGRTPHIEHYNISPLSVSVRSRPYRLPEHKRKIVNFEGRYKGCAGDGGNIRVA